MPDFRRGTATLARESGKGEVFEAGFLPDAEKERLCRSLLAEFGATHVRPGGDGELIHGCLLPFGNHKDQDRNPTASLNYKRLAYNPLAGETLVKTFDGERPIGEMVGTTQRVLDGDGNWVEAEIIYSGIQRLHRVTLRRSGRTREVYATDSHRWMISPKGRGGGLEERMTSTLQPRDRIPSVWSRQRAGRLTVSPFGVARGFVFGDGTCTEHGAVANFAGAKDLALLPYFEGLPVGKTEFGHRVGVGLPRSWKLDLPELDEGGSYLYGWLAGYFAADGCVADDGHVTLSSAKRDHLDHVVAICDRIGVATWGISERSRSGFGREESSIFTLSFRRASLTADFFLISEHRERFELAQSKRSNERANWWVVSVEETDRTEEVFCAIVPTTHSFVLAGNILTGNCLGCGAGGGLLWFIGLCRDETGEKARRWLEDQTGTGADEQSLSSLMSFFDGIYDKQRNVEPPMPRMDAKVLKPWMAIHPYMTEIRGISEQTLMDFNVGYGTIRCRVGADENDDPIFVQSERIVVPHFWKGVLVGWQTRRLMKSDGTPKWLSSPDFPKDQTIYNYDAKQKKAVVVEAPVSVLAKTHLDPHIEGTFGAKVTDKQVRLISMHPRVVLFMDNDEAGWNATRRVGDALEAYSIVEVAQNPWAADPADLDDQTYLDCVQNPIPYALWSPPTALEAWVA